MRFFFFSLEESRIHIHIRQAGKKAKVWLDPEITLAESQGFSSSEIANIIKEVEEHEQLIREKRHCHRRGYND